MTLAAHSKQRTRTSTPSLSSVARHVVKPAGIVTSGWPRVALVLAALGVVFDAWQVGITRLILAKRADGQYAADTAVLSIPRQVGKTYLLGALVFALCILNPGLLAIWTAHHTGTSDETFADLRAFATQPRIAKHIRSIRAANGQQAIVFRNGARIRFGARERGFGRGFKNVGVLVLDEAQILTRSAMDNLIPTTSRAANPLILMAGTPPRRGIDPGDAFSDLRTEALEAEPGDSTTLYVEFSADQDADVSDRSQWRKANPSYPKHTTARAILRMLKHLGPTSFKREALGIWDTAHAGETLVEEATWDALKGLPPEPGGPVAYAVKFSPDNGRVALTVAATCEDGETFVEVVDFASTAAGIGPGARWLAERWRDCDAITVDGQSHAGLLVEELIKKGVPPHKIARPNADEFTTSSARLIEMIGTKSIRHSGQPGLTADVCGVGKRPIGTRGGWGFRAVRPDANDVTVESIALAISGLKELPSTNSSDDDAPRRPTRRKATVM